MIICPKCKHPATDGTVFCEECGAPLAGVESLTTQSIRQTDQFGDAVPVTAPYTSEMPVAQGGWLSLHVLESGQILPLSGRDEFSLGRVAEGQPVMPDVDLTPYKAYSEGVSRLHAVLRRRADRAFVMDLGSSNGTYLNGQRLPVNLEQAIKHGDVIALGKLKIQILLNFS